MVKKLWIIFFLSIFLILLANNNIYAYKTFDIIKENNNYSQAIIINTVNENQVKEPLTLIKIYPKKVYNNDFSELKNYLKTKNINEVYMFSDDDMNFAKILRINLNINLLVKIPKRTNITSEVNDNETTSSLSNITGKSIDYKLSNNHRLVILIALITLIIIIFMIYKLYKK